MLKTKKNENVNKEKENIKENKNNKIRKNDQ